MTEYNTCVPQTDAFITQSSMNTVSSIHTPDNMYYINWQTEQLILVRMLPNVCEEEDQNTVSGTEVYLSIT